MCNKYPCSYFLPIYYMYSGNTISYTINVAEHVTIKLMYRWSYSIGLMGLEHLPPPPPFVSSHNRLWGGILARLIYSGANDVNLTLFGEPASLSVILLDMYQVSNQASHCFTNPLTNQKVHAMVWVLVSLQSQPAFILRNMLAKWIAVPALNYS